MRRFWMIPAVCLLGATAARADEAPPKTVAAVDLQRYVGLWYEIGKIPNRFQKQCVRGTTAEYTLRADGAVDVVNRCTREDGGTDEARGLAKVVDRESNSKLEVSFVRFLGIRLFWGDYWILGLGDDYEYAIVGSPDRRYGWILCRAPRMEPDMLERVHTTLREQGFDPARFEMTSH
jgi:apolipoprotein D and lipocalin family protein